MYGQTYTSDGKQKVLNNHVKLSRVRPLDEESFEWPLLNEIRGAQELSENVCPDTLELDHQLKVKSFLQD